MISLHFCHHRYDNEIISHSLTMTQYNNHDNNNIEHIYLYNL